MAIVSYFNLQHTRKALGNEITGIDTSVQGDGLQLKSLVSPYFKFQIWSCLARLGKL